MFKGTWYLGIGLIRVLNNQKRCHSTQDGPMKRDLEVALVQTLGAFTLGQPMI